MRSPFFNTITSILSRASAHQRIVKTKNGNPIGHALFDKLEAFIKTPSFRKLRVVRKMSVVRLKELRRLESKKSGARLDEVSFPRVRSSKEMNEHLTQDLRCHIPTGLLAR